FGVIERLKQDFRIHIDSSQKIRTGILVGNTQDVDLIVPSGGGKRSSDWGVFNHPVMLIQVLWI
ncbi:MAG: hypothetical protein QGF62_05700, partial [Gammaproteobacteria bacterium]|nr:hypothetical protein [Gammaproteobacteria bacterium]